MMPIDRSESGRPTAAEIAGKAAEFQALGSIGAVHEHMEEWNFEHDEHLSEVDGANLAFGFRRAIWMMTVTDDGRYRLRERLSFDKAIEQKDRDVILSNLRAQCGFHMTPEVSAAVVAAESRQRAHAIRNGRERLKDEMKDLFGGV